MTLAGPMPLASPGVIPPYLPAFSDDPADVTTLKNAYNAAIDQLAAAARAVASAAAGQAADAHAAAQLILTAIDNDGLNNPSGFLHWLDSTVDSVRGFAASHWAQYVSPMSFLSERPRYPRSRSPRDPHCAPTGIAKQNRTSDGPGLAKRWPGSSARQVQRSPS